jgi:opacity protein-like surface antigen
MALGLSWGAGLSWRFARNAELFGSYRFLQFGHDNLSHGDRTLPSDTELTGHDILYGISIRF